MPPLPDLYVSQNLSSSLNFILQLAPSTSVKYPGSEVLSSSYLSKDWSIASKNYAPPLYEAPHVLSYSDDWADPPEDVYDVLLVFHHH